MELEGQIEPQLVTEPNGEGMCQNLAPPPAREMPQVSSPNPFGPETLHQLGDNCLDTAADLGQPPGPGDIFPTGKFERCYQAQALGC